MPIKNASPKPSPHYDYSPPSLPEAVGEVALSPDDVEGVVYLIKVMRRLRQPDGCPWDRAQTHQSLLGNLLEEAYEYFHAVATRDERAMREELGDLLLQVIFHAQIAQEENLFTLGSVAKELAEKLVRRHPHVFSDQRVQTPEEALNSWHQAKGREGAQTTDLNLVPRVFPALLRARKVQEKASRLGFDWEEREGAWQKFLEEIQELQRAIQDGKRECIEEELGDTLFALVNVSRFLGLCPEVALTRTTEKFIRRFEEVSRRLEEKGVDISQATLSQMDAEWEEAKKKEGREEG